MLGDFGDYLGATFGEVGKHPWQALGAAFGVPGWDPAIGGLFNNRPGGALLSPTGNFSSSAWNDMYKDNPGNTAGLDAFHKVNSIADIIAPAVAGYYGAGAAGLGGSGGSTGGANGLTGFFSGPAAYGDSGMTSVVSPTGSGLGSAMSGDMGGALGSSPTGLFSGLLPGGGMTGTSSGALGGGLSGEVAGGSSLGGVSMGGFDFGALSQLGQQLMQQRNQQGQQGQQQQQPMRPMAYGNQPVHNASIGQPTPYTRFGVPQQYSPLQTAALMQAGAMPMGGLYARTL